MAEQKTLSSFFLHPRSIRVNSLERSSIETHWNLVTSPIHLNPNVSPYLFPISLFRDELLDFNLRSILFKPHSARSTATRCSNSRDSSHLPPAGEQSKIRKWGTSVSSDVLSISNVRVKREQCLGRKGCNGDNTRRD